MMTYTTQGLYWQENFRCNPVPYHLISVGPKQLCALAHLGFTREEGPSELIVFYIHIIYR